MTDEERSAAYELVRVLKNLDTDVVMMVSERVNDELRYRISQRAEAERALYALLESDPLPGLIAERLKGSAS